MRSFSTASSPHVEAPLDHHLDSEIINPNVAENACGPLEFGARRGGLLLFWGCQETVGAMNRFEYPSPIFWNRGENRSPQNHSVNFE